MPRQPHVRLGWLSLLLPALLFTTFGPATASTGQTTAPAAASSTAAHACAPVVPLDRTDFPNRPRIDNRFLPLVPGMQYVLEGFVIGDDGLRHPHRVETTVTDLTKVIDGVRTLVVFDRDIQDGVLTESEIFFVAQDHDGTVWLLGEYPEEYANGELTGAPSTWLSGVPHATAGIAMQARPRLGARTYLQGLAPEIRFEDCARVFQTGQHVCVPVGCYDHVLVTDEFAPLDPAGGHQRKLYAPGVGLVRVTAASGVDPETLELTSAERLCRSAFSKIREQAQKQDGRGYRVAREVYGDTAPAKDTLDAHTC
jgi:hypothetical protein